MDTANQIDLYRYLDQVQLNTALLNAAETGNLEASQALIEKGAEIDARDPNGSTPLMHSCRYGHIEVAVFLLQKGANLESRDFCGRTPLMYAASTGRNKTIAFLLKKNANLKAIDSDGHIAFMYACMTDHPITAALLLQQDIEQLEMENSMKKTSLMLACKYNNLRTVHFLLDQGAALTTKSSGSVFLDACRSGKIEVVKILLKHDATQIKALSLICRSTPLILAAENGHNDVIAFLLQQDIKQLKTTDIFGTSPLQSAIKKGQTKTVDFLLKKGAKYHGMSSVKLALEHGYIDTAYLLLSKMSPKKFDKFSAMPGGIIQCENFKEDFKKNTLNVYRSINTHWNIFSREKNILTSLPPDIISYIHQLIIDPENFSPWYHHRILNDMNTAINYFISDKKPPLPAIFSFNPKKRKAQSEPEENRPHKKIALSETETNMVIEEDNNQHRCPCSIQ